MPESTRIGRIVDSNDAGATLQMSDSEPPIHIGGDLENRVSHHERDGDCNHRISSGIDKLPVQDSTGSQFNVFQRQWR